MNQPAISFTPTTTPLQAALTYAARGWPVFPCHAVLPNSGGCTCGVEHCSSPGKHPATRRGFKEATTDLRAVRSMWGDLPRANIGVATGRRAGLVVLDVDPGHGGLASLRALIHDHGQLPITMTVGTGSDGLHFYFAHPGAEIRNSAGSKLGPGLDIRGDGGYVIAPPSHHASGKTYSWAADLDTELAPLPDWMQAALRPPERTRIIDAPTVDLGSVRATNWARAALEAEVRSVLHAPEGTRNHLLNRAAFNLGQIVGGGSLDHGTVETALLDAGLTVGLGESECTATIRSGLTAGEANPRRPISREPRPRKAVRAIDIDTPALP